MGRIVNIVGDRSTSKTLLAIEATANFAHHFRKGDIYYVETESAFDKAYAENLGMPMRRVDFLPNIDTIEDFFEALMEVLRHRDRGRPGIIILDSLDALTDRAEAGRRIDEGTFGAAKAKMMSQLFRRLIRKLEDHNCLVIIISQTRDNINATFGRKYSRSGGRALDFYASQIIYLAHIKTLRRVVNKTDRAVGVIIKAKVEKNKIGTPFREAQFQVRFGYGIDDVAACAQFLEDNGGLGDIEYFQGRKSLSGLLSKLDKTDDETYVSVAKQLRTRTRERWREIEQSFAPSRKKYT